VPCTEDTTSELAGLSSHCPFDERQAGKLWIPFFKNFTVYEVDALTSKPRAGLRGERSNQKTVEQATRRQRNDKGISKNRRVQHPLQMVPDADGSKWRENFQRGSMIESPLSTHQEVPFAYVFLSSFRSLCCRLTRIIWQRRKLFKPFWS